VSTLFNRLVDDVVLAYIMKSEEILGFAHCLYWPGTGSVQTPIVPGAPKRSHLKNFAIYNNFTVLLQRILTLVSPSISHKSGKFYCIMHRLDKTTLLLIMATLGQF